MAASGPISPKRASISSKRLEPHRDSKQSGRALALHRRQMNADVECVSGRKLDGILARSWSTSVTRPDDYVGLQDQDRSITSSALARRLAQSDCALSFRLTTTVAICRESRASVLALLLNSLRIAVSFPGNQSNNSAQRGNHI